MNWHDAALIAAGVTGSSVAVVHGVLVERLMVRPLRATFLGDPRTSGAVRRLVPLLLHFSTVAWFLGGLVLIAAGLGFTGEARLASAVVVAAAYLFGVIGNLWATRGRHPGWMLLGVALLLIVFALGQTGAPARLP